MMKLYDRIIGESNGGEPGLPLWLRPCLPVKHVPGSHIADTLQRYTVVQKLGTTFVPVSGPS